MVSLGSGRERKAARFTRVNLELCFPTFSLEQREALALSSLQHEAYSVVELAPFYTRRAETISRWVDDHEKAVLDQALSEGRGSLLCAPHFGAWEVLGQYLSQSYPLHALYKPAKSKTVDALLLNGRTRFGSTLHQTSVSGVRGLHRALANNEVVSILPDQEPGAAGGEFAPFFGQPALTMTLLMRLAQPRRVPVLLTAAIRDISTQRFRIVFRRLGDAIYHSDPVASLSCMNAAIEDLVREHPEQYLWSYRRFKTQPAGRKRGYLSVKDIS